MAQAIVKPSYFSPGSFWVYSAAICKPEPGLSSPKLNAVIVPRNLRVVSFHRLV